MKMCTHNEKRVNVLVNLKKIGKIQNLIWYRLWIFMRHSIIEGKYCDTIYVRYMRSLKDLQFSNKKVTYLKGFFYLDNIHFHQNIKLILSLSNFLLLLWFRCLLFLNGFSYIVTRTKINFKGFSWTEYKKKIYINIFITIFH